jgi:hypothetical protein
MGLKEHDYGREDFWPGTDAKESESEEPRAGSQLIANSRSYCLPPAVPSMLREAVVLGVAAGRALGGPFSSSAE